MKKFYLLLTPFLFTTFFSYSQWTVLNSGVTNTLRSTYFFNNDTGFVVGESLGPNSPILKTTDGGITWDNTINSGTTQALRAVTFIDENIGIIAGFNGLILRTDDGGTTWNTITSGTILPLRSISFPSHDTGYIGGGHGTILKTIDAGVTWTALTSGLDSDVINIRFANNDVGYAVSSGSNLTGFLIGRVIKTIDGGLTWSTVYYNSNDGLLGLAVPSENIAYAGGKNDLIVKTSDGGQSWTIADSGLTNHQIRAAFFLNENRGWFGCDIGDIFYTENGGATWTNQTVNANGIYGIYFPSTTTGYAVGASGSILKYYNCPTLPAISAINGTSDACEGTPTVYSIGSVAGADSYSWSAPLGSTYVVMDTSIIVTFGTNSGDVTVTAMNHCDTVSAAITVTVHSNPPIPTVTFTSGVLTSSSATTYQWFLNGNEIPGATNQDYTPTVDGTYSVTVTGDFGCSSTSAGFEVIGTGILNIYGDASMEVYPNPFVGSTVFSMFPSASIDQSKLIITDIKGRLVSRIDINPDHPKISWQSLPGIYIYQWVDKNGNLIMVGKLVAQ